MSDRALLFSIFFFFNLIFPFLGWFFLILFFLLTPNRSRFESGLVYIGLNITLVFVAYNYIRVNDTGDIYQYSISLIDYSEGLGSTRESVVSGVYESFYPVWYFILYVTSFLDFDINFISSIAVLCIYGVQFFILYKLYSILPSEFAEKHMLMKVLMFFSIFILISSYKTMWAFSLVALGLFYLMNKKRIGWVFALIGLGLHPVAVFPLFAYLMSRFFHFKIFYLYFSVFLGLFSKLSIKIFSGYLLSVPFIGEKVSTYLYGDWASYRFHENSEYVLFFIMIFIIILSFVSIFNTFSQYKGFFCFGGKGYFNKYNNFIAFYLCLSLLFIGFRTIESRLIVSGFVFFIPLFYQMLNSLDFRRLKTHSIVFIMAWVFLIDIRYFNFGNEAYIVGEGLPYNLLASPLLLFITG